MIIHIRRLILIVSSLFVGILAGCGPNDAASGLAGKLLPSLHITDWGPRETKVGVAVNPQPDGVSAIWIGVKGVEADGKAIIKYSDGITIPATVQPSLVTASVPSEIINKAGEYEVTIVEGSGRATAVGIFKVTP